MHGMELLPTRRQPARASVARKAEAAAEAAAEREREAEARKQAAAARRRDALAQKEAAAEVRLLKEQQRRAVAVEEQERRAAKAAEAAAEAARKAAEAMAFHAQKAKAAEAKKQEAAEKAAIAAEVAEIDQLLREEERLKKEAEVHRARLPRTGCEQSGSSALLKSTVNAASTMALLQHAARLVLADRPYADAYAPLFADPPSTEALAFAGQCRTILHTGWDRALGTAASAAKVAKAHVNQAEQTFACYVDSMEMRIQH